MRCCLMRLLCKHKKGTKGYDLVPSKVGHGRREDKDNSKGFGRDDALLYHKCVSRTHL